MSNELAKPSITLPGAFAGAQQSAKMAGIKTESAGDGVEGSFGVLKYKGKVWSIRWKGKEYQFLRPDGDGPRNSIDVVVVKMSPTKSKSFYPGTFVEGERKRPTCWSNDAIRPDPSIPHPQARGCAECPQNQLGSRVTDSGKQSRACADFKRVAVVLEPSLAQSTVGSPLSEPVLMRIPAMSLNDFSSYGDNMKTQNWKLQSIVTKVSFDPTVAYPRFKFEPVRPLNDAEVDAVLELRDHPVTARVLGEGAGDDVTTVGYTVNPPVAPLTELTVESVNAALTAASNPDGVVHPSGAKAANAVPQEHPPWEEMGNTPAPKIIASNVQAADADTNERLSKMFPVGKQ